MCFTRLAAICSHSYLFFGDWVRVRSLHETFSIETMLQRSAISKFISSFCAFVLSSFLFFFPSQSTLSVSLLFSSVFVSECSQIASFWVCLSCDHGCIPEGSVEVRQSTDQSTNEEALTFDTMLSCSWSNAFFTGIFHEILRGDKGGSSKSSKNEWRGPTDASKFRFKSILCILQLIGRILTHSYLFVISGSFVTADLHQLSELYRNGIPRWKKTSVTA